MQRILVTTGLPYANADLHLGHILENIQADIWVRFKRMQQVNGKPLFEVVFVSADDAHGTPIMLAAEKNHIAPEEMIAAIKIRHMADFVKFHIEFDNFHTTHSEENKELTQHIYNKLKASGDIEVKTIEQFFDPEKKMFLPDRLIKGTCPRCKAKDQYGDNCEVCGATYAPTDLIDPISRVSDAKPVLKSSEHYFFKLEKYRQILEEWMANDKTHLNKAVRHKMEEWLKIGLKSWDISRDAPYFGFEIPDAPGKYFYVWLDAPVGYMASLKNLCARRPDLDFDSFWQEGVDSEVYHFIGKDIMYFHHLFWPAILSASGYRKPTRIITHGLLVINGAKMSKSRGNFISLPAYVDAGLNPEYLRYYLASKLNDGIDDIDFNWNDFTQRVNSDLVGKVVNIASRTAKFIQEYFAGELAATMDMDLFEQFLERSKKIGALYGGGECAAAGEKINGFQYSEAMREIMALADLANKYIDDKKPWQMIKDPANREEVQRVCTLGINLFRLLIIYLKPVLPSLARKSEEFLQIAPMNWPAVVSGENQKLVADNKWDIAPLLKHVIKPFQPLLERVPPNLKIITG